MRSRFLRARRRERERGRETTRGKSKEQDGARKKVRTTTISRKQLHQRTDGILTLVQDPLSSRRPRCAYASEDGEMGRSVVIGDGIES